MYWHKLMYWFPTQQMLPYFIVRDGNKWHITDTNSLLANQNRRWRHTDLNTQYTNIPAKAKSACTKPQICRQLFDLPGQRFSWETGTQRCLHTWLKRASRVLHSDFLANGQPADCHQSTASIIGDRAKSIVLSASMHFKSIGGKHKHQR